MARPALALAELGARLIESSAKARRAGSLTDPLDRAAAWSELLGIARRASARLERLGDEFERRADTARADHIKEDT
jgi:hypothetical protein